MSGGAGIRARCRRPLYDLATALSRPLDAESLARPAVVFAPHPDDETLGCGGLIALKTAAAVPVTIVFMTDGEGSHARFEPAEIMAPRRREEALAACAELGVPASRVIFLGLPDGGVAARLEDARREATAILASEPARQVLIPYRGDTTPDHRATAAAVLAAAARSPGVAEILEYPVWFWIRWPWSEVRMERRLRLPGRAGASLGAACDLLRHLRRRVDTASVLAIKRRALERHGSQVVRPAEHPRWPILADVGGGWWLEAFFTGSEFYRRTEPSRETPAPLLTVGHLPSVYRRRAGAFTANICGAVGAADQVPLHSLNDGPWVETGRGKPRAPGRDFTIEIPAESLNAGRNRIALRARAGAELGEPVIRAFGYDPSPIRPPLVREWTDGDLDVQDGRWETCLIDGERRVRPVPGCERYDRILVVAGAFAGGRRIETDLVFRRAASPGRSFGFGVLPQWGGHPDPGTATPRRGWRFSLAWYYSLYRSIGLEFSTKDGAEPPRFAAIYHHADPVPGRRLRLIVEARTAAGGDGPARHRQRMKWWPADEPEPQDWIELDDRAGAPLPHLEYGVALIASRCQVDFGTVKILPLADGDPGPANLSGD